MRMKHLTLILYVLLTVVLAVATLVEHSKGTEFVVEHIYHSVPFIVLWGALGVLMIFSLWKKTFFQVGPKILLHFSFLLILAGALTTYLTSSKGMMHLRMGEPSFQYMEGESRLMRSLPLMISFCMVSPRNFVLRINYSANTTKNQAILVIMFRNV